MNRFFPILLLTALPTLFLQADEKSVVWERIYDKALNDQMRYEVMVNIRSLREPAFVPLLVNALTDVISRRIELGNTNEVDAKVRLATQIIDALGDLKDSSGADLLFQVYKEIKTFPLLRSDAAMALGKARASDYAIDLAKALDSINLQPDRDNAKAQEIVAFGLVQALAMMKDPVGFEPTFFASIGWYSPARKVKEIAKTSKKSWKNTR
jgi:HEAT repeat protein